MGVYLLKERKAGVTNLHHKRNEKMKKKTVVILLLATVILVWIFLTAECVIDRAASGIPIDWANIKDCSY